MGVDPGLLEATGPYILGHSLSLLGHLVAVDRRFIIASGPGPRVTAFPEVLVTDELLVAQLILTVLNHCDTTF